MRGFSADFLRCNEIAFFMGLDPSDFLFGMNVIHLLKSFWYGVIIVDQVVFDDKIVDVKIEILLFFMLRERVVAEFHPLSR